MTAEWCLADGNFGECRGCGWFHLHNGRARTFGRMTPRERYFVPPRPSLYDLCSTLLIAVITGPGASDSTA